MSVNYIKNTKFPVDIVTLNKGSLLYKGMPEGITPKKMYDEFHKNKNTYSVSNWSVSILPTYFESIDNAVRHAKSIGGNVYSFRVRSRSNFLNISSKRTVESVLKYCKSIGYSHYKELKKAINIVNSENNDYKLYEKLAGEICKLFPSYDGYITRNVGTGSPILLTCFNPNIIDIVGSEKIFYKRMDNSGHRLNKESKKVGGSAGVYGHYTGNKISEFLIDKMSFGNKVLENFLITLLKNPNNRWEKRWNTLNNNDEDVTMKSIESLPQTKLSTASKKFRVEYAKNSSRAMYGEKSVDSNDLWQNMNKISRKFSAQLNKFRNNIDRYNRDPPVLKRIDYTDLIINLSKSSNFTGKNRRIYLPSFSHEPKRNRSVYWLSTDYNQARGYILDKALQNREYVGKEISGCVFVHEGILRSNSRFLDLDRISTGELLNKFSITEYMLVHEMDVVGNLICREINKILRKNNEEEFSGLYSESNRNCVILCSIKDVEFTSSQVYKSPSIRYSGFIPPAYNDSAETEEQEKIYKKFYNPPSIYIHSNGAHYRHIVEQIINIDRLDGEKINKNLLNVVIASITNVMRPYIYETIAKLNSGMKNLGKFILAGGDAINLLIPPHLRDVSPDIDTKFIIRFFSFVKEFSENSSIMNEQARQESDFFYNLLQARDQLWNIHLQKLLNDWNNKETYTKFYNELLRPLECEFPFNLLGITFIPPSLAKKNKPFRKRLTLMTKVQNPPKGKNPFLFDVDLFAIDIYLNSNNLISWYIDKKGDTQYTNKFGYMSLIDSPNVTGILDMPFQHPTHLGYSLGNPKYYDKINIDIYRTQQDENKYFFPKTSLNNIISIKSQVRNRLLPPIKSNFTIPIANTEYAFHDTELLTRLKLRKGDKLKKDRRRLAILKEYRSKNVKENNEEYIEYIDQTAVAQVKTVVSDIATLKISKIVRFLAIPEISSSGISQIRGFINCDSTIPITAEYETFNRFKYIENRWVPCCDIIPNQFRFRYDDTVLRSWGENYQAKQSLKCILKQWDKYLRNIKNYSNIVSRAEQIGVMLYGFRPIFFNNPKFKKSDIINLMVNNILIYASGLKTVGGEIGKLSKRVYNSIKQLK
jgi:hypothetical protein